MSAILLLKYLKTILKTLVLPPSGLVLMLWLGIALLRRAPRAGRSLIIAATVLLWLLSTPVVAGYMAAFTERYPPLDIHRPVDAQAIVILGGGGQRMYAPEYGGAEAEPYLLERIAYGAWLAQHTGLPILVTGFHGEAIAMRDTLERHFGIKARWVEDQSFDTFDNASNSVRMLHADGIERIILVTRATHLGRAANEFVAAGMQVVPAPVGVQTPRDPFPWVVLPSPGALSQSHDAIYECLGEFVRRVLVVTHLRRH